MIDMICQRKKSCLFTSDLDYLLS